MILYAIATIGVTMTSGAGAAPLSVRIRLGDHGFRFRNIGFRASRVRLKVINQGHEPHAVAVSKSGPDQAVLTQTGTLRPGQSATVVLSIPPGDYRLFSPVDHDSAHGLTAQMKMMAPTLPNGAEMDRVFYNYR
jgi:hypothetical protein